MTDEKLQSMADKLCRSIKDGAVKMKPRWHFVLHTTLIIVGSFLAFFAVVYLISLIIFILRQTGLLYAPSFGFRGMTIFLRSLPWVLILLSLIFIVGLELLVKQHRKIYRQPLLYSVVGVIGIVFFGGVVVAQTPLHNQLDKRAYEDRLPVAGRIYQMIDQRQMQQVHPGVIVEITPTGFIMVSRHGDQLFVATSTITKLPPQKILEVGHGVVVVGESEEAQIAADGVKSMRINNMKKLRPRLHTKK